MIVPFVALANFNFATIQLAKLKPGQVISKSTKIKTATYSLPNSDESWQKSAIKVTGNNIVVDFGGSKLLGSPVSALPSDRKGLGVIVQGNNITIKNLRISGYKVGLLARKCTGLKLINCNFSYNWKQRLLSTTAKEDESDWMSYHHNEKGEWLRYGAGAYLDECTKFEINNLKVTGGQCALMLNRSNGGLIWNCDLSYNSAIGLGMYRSSGNRVMHNKMDFCVRGYSHGVYNRGQDSSGILIFEQCNKNTFAYNSATHGGDGFFLWAGQDTMDSGLGGCNDNLLFANDFSHSPCNAIEATFSRNRFINNLLIDSWHGVWGGYSYDTVIAGNVFGFNGESIAIEHGQNNQISGNSFYRDTNSIRLWQNPGKPDPNWGYPKKRNTANVGSQISGNSITISQNAIDLSTGERITITGNSIAASETGIKASGTVTECAAAGNAIQAIKPILDNNLLKLEGNSSSTFEGKLLPNWMTAGGNSYVQNEPAGADYAKLWKQFGWQGQWQKGYPKPLPGSKNALDPQAPNRGRKYILIDEWGPYDFQRPILWPREVKVDNKLGMTTTKFEILGPAGSWKAEKLPAGILLSQKSGKVPGMVEARWSSTFGEIKIPLVYTGKQTTDFRGIVTPAGRPVKFSWQKSFMPIDWSVRFWAWDEKSDPRTQIKAFEGLYSQSPLAQFQSNELNFASGGSPFQGVPTDHFATLATGNFKSGAGTYALSVTADDGVRVILDGKTIIDEWHWQAPTTYNKTVQLKAGSHQLTIKHFEIDGYTALKVDIRKP